MIVTREFVIGFAEPAARRWLRDYFARPARRGSLPAKVRRWLEGRGPRGASKSLIAHRCERRLIVSRQRCISAGAIVLGLEVLSGKGPEGARRHGSLTKREAEVVFWAGASKSNGEISLILEIEKGTVRKHLERAYEKLGVENRTAAAAVARLR